MKPKFKKMTAAQKRVAIARDVLKQIKARKFIIRTNHYLLWGDRSPLTPFSKETLTKADVKPCQCCAVGSAIASGLRLFNEDSVQFIDGCNAPLASKVISRWFPKKQAAAMEMAFEIRQDSCRLKYFGQSESLMADAGKFGVKHMGDETKRAIAIFRNIIRNEGTFKP